MDFTDCKNITKLPDLSVIAPNIKMLILDRCENLVEIHQSVGLLEALEHWSLYGCESLKIIPRILKLKSLQWFCLWKFSDIWQSKERLALPLSIGNLTSLHTLYICSKNLNNLPSCFCTIPNLKFLCMYGFQNFSKNLDITDCFAKLETLLVMYSDITTLPDISSRFPQLKKLYIAGYWDFHKIPRLPLCISNVFVSGRKSLDSQSSRRLLRQVHLSQRFNFG